MWNGAALQRAKKMAPLRDFLSSKKQVNGIDDSAIMERLRAYSERVKCQS